MSSSSESHGTHDLNATAPSPSTPEYEGLVEKLQAIVDDFDAEVADAIEREERPDLWDGGVDVHVSTIRQALAALTHLATQLEQVKRKGRRDG